MKSYYIFFGLVIVIVVALELKYFGFEENDVYILLAIFALACMVIGSAKRFIQHDVIRSIIIKIGVLICISGVSSHVFYKHSQHNKLQRSLAVQKLDKEIITEDGRLCLRVPHSVDRVGPSNNKVTLECRDKKNQINIHVFSFEVDGDVKINDNESLQNIYDEFRKLLVDPQYKSIIDTDGRLIISVTGKEGIGLFGSGVPKLTQLYFVLLRKDNQCYNILVWSEMPYLEYTGTVIRRIAESVHIKEAS